MKLVEISLSALALAIATPAFGQVTSEASATAADSTSQAGNQTGDDIVVTGEKINRTLQQTPASVAVTTAETIDNEGLVDLYDVLQRTPNVTAWGNKTDFTIRGIDAFNSTGGDGPLASVYLDGAVLPTPALAVGPLDLFDIAQVEVFRGPQSTVQGRNALAGAVIIRTVDPSYEWTGRAQALLTGPDGVRRVAAAVGGPIVGDQLAFRVAGELADSDGFIRNVTTGGNGDQRPSETIRGKLLFTPTFAPGLRIVATYMHDRHRRGTYWTEFDAPYRPQDRISTEDYPDQVTVKSDIATLEAGYDLAPGISLSSVTNYSNIRSRDQYDQDRSAAPGQEGLILDPSKTFQQEVRFNLDKSWVKGVIGGYYLRDDNRGYLLDADESLSLDSLGVNDVLAGDPYNLTQPVIDAVNALYGGSVSIATTILQPKLTHNYAGFADLTFPITTRLRVVAGLRYDSETQDRGSSESVVLTRPLPDPASAPIALQPIVSALNALLEATAAGANSVNPVRPVTYHAWLPKAGITYDLAQDTSLSLTAQRGYRAGGSGLNQGRAAYYTYDPEYTWNYEFALRSEFWDHRLTVNANVYYIDWRDQQVSVQLTPGSAFDTQTVNAGHSRLYGAELSVAARPTSTLSLYGGLGYSNTKFLDFRTDLGEVPDLSGNQFGRAPHWTLSGGGTWQSAGGLFANVNATYRSAYFQDPTDEAIPDIRPLTLVNAKVGWKGEHFGAYLVASNIFNVTKITQSFVDSDGRARGVVTDPRVLGISLEGRF